jgi:hypothetical protein
MQKMPPGNCVDIFSQQTVITMASEWVAVLLKNDTAQ